jgi:hypothetical protein
VILLDELQWRSSKILSAVPVTKHAKVYEKAIC